MSARFIWDVLGISRTEDEGAIRRAYAARLKQTNPEDDAEGFKRLRQAYDAALQQARWARQEREWEEQRRHEEADPPADDDTGYAADGWYGEDESHDVLADPTIGRASAPSDETADEITVLRHQLKADIDAHNRARMALADAIRDGAPPEHLLGALQALLATSAMSQVDVHASTSHWLSGIVHQCRPLTDVLVDPMINFFGWTPDVRHGRDWNGPQSVLALREWIVEEGKAKAYLDRIAGRRHEFNRAWQETRKDKPFTAKTGLARAWALRRLTLMERFLGFTDHKFPAALGALDPDAVAWWRRQSATPGFARTLARHLSGFNILRYTVVAFLLIIIALALGEGGQTRQSADGNSHHAMREACREEARRWRPPKDYTGTFTQEPHDLVAALLACRETIKLIPESLLLKQYAAIIELRMGDPQMALPLAQEILKVSPFDPAALYIKGLALADRDPDGPGRLTMQQALALDPGVDDRLRAFHVAGLPDLAPAKDTPEFAPRLLLPFDSGPKDGDEITQKVVDRAYDHMGFRSMQGKAVLECLVRATGRLDDCRIQSEEPLNKGVGELAIRISASRTISPATKNGTPVDGLPMLIPYGFAPSPASSTKPPADQPAPLDFRDYDDTATGIAEEAVTDQLQRYAKADRARLRARYADLNGDGAPEIVALLSVTYPWGSVRNTVYLLRRGEDGRYQPFFKKGGVDEVRLLDSLKDRWRDIRLDSGTYRYDGKQYVSY